MICLLLGDHILISRFLFLSLSSLFSLSFSFFLSLSLSLSLFFSLPFYLFLSIFQLFGNFIPWFLRNRSDADNVQLLWILKRKLYLPPWLSLFMRDILLLWLPWPKVFSLLIALMTSHTVALPPHAVYSTLSIIWRSSLCPSFPVLPTIGAHEIRSMLQQDVSSFAEHHTVQTRLDDFYMSRIGIRMVGWVMPSELRKRDAVNPDKRYLSLKWFEVMSLEVLEIMWSQWIKLFRLK